MPSSVQLPVRSVTKHVPGQRPARVHRNAMHVFQTKAQVLEALARQGIVSMACESAGISNDLHWKWVQTDPQYAAAVEIAKERAADKLEEEAWRRAVVGWEEPIYQGGKLVGTKHLRSDVLLIFMMKGARPMKYRDNSPITNINASGPVQVNLNV